MNAWLSARRIKKGQEEEFRSRWRGGRTPEGMLDAFLLQDEEDPRETLSISFWDAADQLLKYRTSDDAKKRHDDLTDVVDKDRWSRAFVAFSSLDIPTRGSGKRWLMLPLLLIGAGAAAYFLLARRGRNGTDEWESWEPEPASTFQPGEAPAAFDRDSHNGDRRTEAAPATATRSGAQPASMQTGAQGSMAAAGTVPRTTSPEPTSAATTAARTTTSARAKAEPESGTRRTVRDFMTPNPETVETTTDVAAAARLMRDLNVGVLPVTADGNLAGIITDRDIVLGVSQRAADPVAVRVADLMTDVPATIGPDESVGEAARLMAERQIRRLPVTEGTRLVGILSLGDIAADGAEQSAGAALHDISEPAKPNR